VDKEVSVTLRDFKCWNREAPVFSVHTDPHYIRAEEDAVWERRYPFSESWEHCLQCCASSWRLFVM